MKIAVCIKQIVQTYARTGKEADNYFLTDQDRIFRINPYDEVAMEMAVRMKKDVDDLKITAVILGPVIAQTELIRCLALGADDVLQIETDSTPIDPWQKSGILAAAIKDIRPDIVLCGKESLDSQNGQVAAFLSHHLGLGFVSAATRISIDQNNSRAIVHRNGGRGIKEIFKCKLPAVISVDLSDIEPHVPTYEEKKQAGFLPFKTIKITSDIPFAKVSAQSCYPPRPRPKPGPVIQPELEPYERILQLLSPASIQKKGVMKKGDPGMLADELIAFLKENNFLKVP
jgi:electron transfer flavoprotein beta subunit